jgi:preprotein translocase subunit SecB
MPINGNLHPLILQLKFVPLAMDSPLRQAQQMLAIQDVYVRSAQAFSAPDFDPGLVLQNLQVQFRINANSNAETIEADSPNGPVKFIRYLVDTGLRILKPDREFKNPEVVAQEDLLAEITGVFVVKYVVSKNGDISDEHISVFSDNAVHHMWPYWREFIQATTARLRLPAVVLPMRSTQPPSENKSPGEIATTKEK